MEGVDCSARKYNWTTTQLKRTTCIADLKQNLNEENIIQRDYFCIGGKTGAVAVRKLGAAYPRPQPSLELRLVTSNTFQINSKTLSFSRFQKFNE